MYSRVCQHRRHRQPGPTDPQQQQEHDTALAEGQCFRFFRLAAALGFWPTHIDARGEGGGGRGEGGGEWTVQLGGREVVSCLVATKYFKVAVLSVHINGFSMRLDNFSFSSEFSLTKGMNIYRHLPLHTPLASFPRVRSELKNTPNLGACMCVPSRTRVEYGHPADLIRL